MPRKVVFCDKIHRTSVRNIDEALRKPPRRQMPHQRHDPGPRSILKPPSTFPLPRNVSNWPTLTLPRSKRKKKTTPATRKNSKNKLQVVHHFRLSQQLGILAKSDHLDSYNLPELLDRLDLGKLPMSLRINRRDSLPDIDGKMKQRKSIAVTRETSLPVSETRQEQRQKERGAERLMRTSVKDGKKVSKFPDIGGKLQTLKDAEFMKKSLLDARKMSFPDIDGKFEKERDAEMVTKKSVQNARKMSFPDIDAKFEKEKDAESMKKKYVRDARRMSFPDIGGKFEKERDAEMITKKSVRDARRMSCPDMDGRLRKERGAELVKKRNLLDAREMSFIDIDISGQFENERDSTLMKKMPLRSNKKMSDPDISERLENDRDVELVAKISAPYERKPTLPVIDEKSTNMEAVELGKKISSDARKEKSTNMEAVELGKKISSDARKEKSTNMEAVELGKKISSDARKASLPAKNGKRKKEIAAKRLKESLVLPNINAKHKMPKTAYVAITSPQRSAVRITKAGPDRAPTCPRRGQTSAGMLHAIYNDTSCLIQ